MQHSKQKVFKSFVALGLNSLLPYFSLADGVRENLKKVLAKQDRDTDSQKNQILQDYSPIADLRQKSGREVNIETWGNAQRGTKSWQSDSKILIQKSNSKADEDVDFSVSNNATVTFDANVPRLTNMNAGDGTIIKTIYVGSPAHYKFSGNGTFIFDIDIGENNVKKAYIATILFLMISMFTQERRFS